MEHGVDVLHNQTARRFGRAAGGMLVALALGLCGVWLSERPAWAQEAAQEAAHEAAQEAVPEAGEITRPEPVYPTEYPTEGGERRADEVAGEKPAGPLPAQSNGPVALPRVWREPTFDGPELAPAGIRAEQGRFAPAGPTAPLAGTFSVNTTADNNIGDNFLSLREAILVANGTLIGPFTAAEQAQLTGCSFNGAGSITGGCGANIQDSIFFAPALGFRPIITLSSALPPINDTQPTLLLGAFLFNNVQPVINAQNLTGTQPGLVVNSNENQIVAVSVISAPGAGIRLNGNQNLVGTWTMARNNGSDGIYIAGLTNTVSNSYIGVFSNTVTNQFDCAGNAYEGIYLASSARATTIQKNRIGCNGWGGIMVGNSSDNLIGGPDYSTQGNTIYNNTFEGIYISGSDARRNVVQANDIIDNRFGVRISAGRQNTITIGASSGDYNFIGYNGFDGVLLEGGAQDNLLAEALIGYNGRHGVNLVDTGTTANLITRTASYLNAGDGIRQDPDAGPNFWREVRIYDNGGLGIDINAADDSSNTPNPFFFYITSVNQNTGLVQGKANGTSFLVITIVDLYRIDLDPSGFGEGYQFVGSDTTDSNGDWSITDPDPALSRGCYTAVVRGVAIVVPYATEFSRTNCVAFVPIARKP